MLSEQASLYRPVPDSAFPNCHPRDDFMFKTALGQRTLQTSWTQVPVATIVDSHKYMADTTEQVLRDKDGVPIHVGEMVSSRHRTGRQFGSVVDIVVTEEEAKGKHVAHPPKVLFYTQKGESLHIPTR